MNFIPEILDVQGGKNTIVLYPSPGVEVWGTATSTNGEANRGNISVRYQGVERAFSVFGDQLIEFSSLGIQIGSATVTFTDTTPVTMSYNGDAGGQIFITSCGDGFLYDLAANSFSPIAALAGIATMGVMLDGFFGVLDTVTSTFYISDLNDGSVWDPTQFYQRSIASDPYVSLQVTYQNIYLIGTATSDVLENVGTFPFPFAPIANALIPYGTSAPYSATLVSGTLCWLTQTVKGRRQVVQVDGVSTRIISTRALERALSGYSQVSGGTGHSYEDHGHIFYILTLPAVDITHVYDTTTQLWVKFLSWYADAYHAWRPMFHFLAFDLLLAGDSADSVLYRLSVDLPLDVDDLPIRRLRRAPALFSEHQLIYIEYLELFLEAGLGLASGQGSDPQVMLRVSKDGGKTWGSELWRSAGTIGQYSKRVRWNRLGRGRDLVFEFVFSDPIPWRIINSFFKGEQAA